MEFVELQRTIRYHLWRLGLDCYLNAKPPKLREKCLIWYQKNFNQILSLWPVLQMTGLKLLVKYLSLIYQNFIQAIINYLTLLYYKYKVTQCWPLLSITWYHSIPLHTSWWYTSTCFLMVHLHTHPNGTLALASWRYTCTYILMVYLNMHPDSIPVHTF